MARMYGKHMPVYKKLSSSNCTIVYFYQQCMSCSIRTSITKLSTINQKSIAPTVYMGTGLKIHPFVGCDLFSG